VSANAPHYDLVDVAPLREAFEQSGLTLSEVCRRLGWYCSKVKRPGTGPDTSRLRRTLGMQPHSSSYGPYVNRRIGYDLAARIAEAIGVDPVEVGL
jgi:hypothetical protein